MSLFSRGKATTTKPVPEEVKYEADLPRISPGAAGQADAAVDALAGFLRTFGKYPLDIEGMDIPEFQRVCEAWALHVLVGTPWPGQDEEESKLPKAGIKREYNRMRQFLTDQRQKEQSAVLSSVGNMRDALWTFIESLGSAVVDENESDVRVTEQIERIRTAVESKTTEELKKEVLSAVSTLTEITDLRRAQNQARIEELGQVVSALSTELQQARQEQELDGLTRLYNRAAFDQNLARLANLRHLFGQPASLFLIDVDEFKSINDTYGHPGGDAALKALSECLSRVFPRRNDCVARFGGDEFAVILGDTPIKDAVRLGHRLLDAVHETKLEHDGREIEFTISIGIAEIGPVEDPALWVSRADQGLYTAKKDGRDRLREGPPVPAE